jgi:short-subunit dehydrogenase
MANSFSEKTALITGGSSGIVLALAKQLFAEGANVWLMARNEERLLAAQSAIEALRVNQA